MTDRVSAALSKGTGASDPLIGRTIGGRFKVTALIARGGMGKVYRAEQSPLGRICALKVLNPSYAGEHDPEFHKRFFLEASIASKLTHPNTVTIFDYGRTDDEIYYMAMEYLEGQTLHRAIRDAGHLPEERATHIARQMCRALREAHALGVIHRDLKPANIFLVQHGDEADFVKVLDFGLVKNVADKGEDLTQTGMFMGSPKYMAPEQIRGDPVDARTDVYALGIILYEMLTGKVPFDRATSVNILMAHVHDEAPPMREVNPNIQVSQAAEAAVLGCMAKDPEQRFRSMGDVLEALKKGSAANAAQGGVSPADSSLRPSITGSGPKVAAAIGSASRLSQSGETVAQGAAAPSGSGAAGGSRGTLVAACAAALGLAAVIGYIAVKPTKSEQAPAFASRPAEVAPSAVAAPGPPPNAQAPVVASTAARAPVIATTKITVDTEPDGASVREDGVELCSSTPCDIVFKGEDADPNRVHKLALARQGYRQETRSVKPGDPALLVKLTPAPRPAPPPPQPRASDVPAMPTGYKTEIPY